MAGVFDSLARGVESGFNMGLRADAAAEERRARKVQEERQARADARLEEENEIGARRRADEDFTRSAGLRMKVLGERKGELESLSVAARTANQPIDPAVASEYAGVEKQLSSLRQQAMDYWSRVQGGRIDPEQTPDADLYRNTAVAIGRRPEELPEIVRAIDDMQDAIGTGNAGLAVQSANTLMAPQLRRGIGTPSPYGGKIIRKEIIGLDPARGGDGRDHPNMVIPRLRVYVQMDELDGKQYHYDAPMSKGGGTDDAPVAIDISRAMDWMGNMGVLAAALQKPEFRAKLEEGSKKAGAEVDMFLQQLTQIADSKKPKPTIRPIGPNGLAEFDAQGNVIGVIEPAKKAPAAAVQTLEARMAAVDALEGISDAEKTRLKRDITLGAGGRTTGLVQKPGGGGGSGSGGGTGAGGKPSAALGGAVAPDGVGADAVDFWAKAVIAGDRDWQVGLGRSKSGASLIEAVKRRVPELAKELGLEPQDIGTTRAQSAALGATMKELTKRAEAVELFASKVEKDMRTLDAELDKAALSSPLLINRPINFLRREFSDPALARLDLAAKQVGAEYERLITGGTLSVAQLHVGAQEDAKKLINGDMTPKQARAVMDIMRTEMQNARDAAHESEIRIRERMQALGRGRDAAPGGTPTAPKPAGGTPQPTAADIAWARESPKNRENFVKAFGREP
jgi:hypothetical protein